MSTSTPSLLQKVPAGTTSAQPELASSGSKRKRRAEKQKMQKQPMPPSASNEPQHPSHMGDSSFEIIIQWLSVLESEKKAMEDQLTGEKLDLENRLTGKMLDLEHRLMGEKLDLENRLTVMQSKHARLENELSTTMSAVAGDIVALNEIRQRVLLDMAHEKLAVLCGF